MLSERHWQSKLKNRKFSKIGEKRGFISNRKYSLRNYFYTQSAMILILNDVNHFFFEEIPVICQRQYKTRSYLLKSAVFVTKTIFINESEISQNIFKGSLQ